MNGAPDALVRRRPSAWTRRRHPPSKARRLQLTSSSGTACAKVASRWDSDRLHVRATYEADRWSQRCRHAGGWLGSPQRWCARPVRANAPVRAFKWPVAGGSRARRAKQGGSRAARPASAPSGLLPPRALRSIRASTRCAGTCTRAGPPRAHAHAPSAPLGVLRRRLEESRVWARFARPVLLPCRFARPPPPPGRHPASSPQRPHTPHPSPHSIPIAATPPTSPRYSSGVCVVPQA